MRLSHLNESDNLMPKGFKTHPRYGGELTIVKAMNGRGRGECWTFVTVISRSQVYGGDVTLFRLLAFPRGEGIGGRTVYQWDRAIFIKQTESAEQADYDLTRMAGSGLTPSYHKTWIDLSPQW